MEGEKLLSQICNRPQATAVSVIVMVPQATVPPEVERLATALVPSSFDVETLLLVIERLMENRSLQRRALGG